MKKWLQLNQVLGLSIITFLVADRASAAVSYQINNGGLLGGFNIGIDGTSYSGVLAGGLKITQTGVIDPTAPSEYITLCADVQGTLYLGSTYTYNAPVAFGSLSGLNPTWGANNSAAQAIQNAAELFYTHLGELQQSGNEVNKAALQLAVWSALYNTDALGAISGSRFTFGGGDAAAVAQANIWLGLLATDPSGLTYTGGIFVPSPDIQYGHTPQELLYAPAPVTSSSVSPVPEPTTVIAGALLLLPFGASAVRVLRKKRV